MEIDKGDKSELIQKVIDIGSHRSLLELEIEKIADDNWSPFELKIKKRDYAELIQMMITIGTHWSPLEGVGPAHFF